MGNQTTVRDVTVGGSIAMLFIWILSHYQPELAQSLPDGGEAAMALLIASTFAYIKEPKK